MARFMISMPEEMIKEIDRRAREEHRTRSELLREAIRQHLARTEARVSAPVRSNTIKRRNAWTKEALEQHLMAGGLARKGCPGLDVLLGPIKGPWT